MRGHLRLIAGAAALVAGLSCAQAQGTYPIAQRAGDRAVRRRRPDRRDRARGSAEADRQPGTAILRGEPARAPAATPAPRTAAKAPADGYTLLVVSTGFMVNPSLYAKVPYDPVKDFAPLTLVAESPNVLFVHPSVPAKTVKELIDLVKANPGKYSYAQPSTGSTPHLSGELFKLTYGLDLVMVPFTSAALAVNSTHRGAHADRLHGAAAGASRTSRRASCAALRC